MRHAQISFAAGNPLGGFYIRLWCYRCARGVIVREGPLLVKLSKMGELTIDEVRKRLRCGACQSRVDVLIVPAWRPSKPIEAPTHYRSWQHEVENWFLNERPRFKMRKRR